MTVGFNDIGNNLRVPLVYIEFDNSRAVSGTPGLNYKVLMLGQKTSEGALVANAPARITSTEKAKVLAGRGSPLALMLEAAIKANASLDLWAVALEDNNAGSAATGQIVVSQAASKNGTIALYIGGQRITVGVQEQDAEGEIAANIAAAINAAEDLPVSAVAMDAAVSITAKCKGELGNDIALLDSYYDDESLPEGLQLAYTALQGGAGNPDIGDALDVLGDEWYNVIVSPYTDSANLNVLKDELLSRWGPMRMIDGIAFTAKHGSFGELSTFGEGRNDHLVTCMDAGESPTPAFIWAAVNAAVAAGSLEIDPARPLQTLLLPGILPAKISKRRTLTERNILLHSGISSHKVDAAGQVMIERQITTYQKNAMGANDPSYLDVNTPATLSYLRYSTRTRIQLRFPRHKLADNGTLIAPGQPIVTPNVIKGELIALAGEWLEQGLIENFEQFKTELVVERNQNDRNRVDVLASPDLINQFRIFAEQIQFIL